MTTNVATLRPGAKETAPQRAQRLEREARALAFDIAHELCSDLALAAIRCKEASEMSLLSPVARDNLERLSDEITNRLATIQAVGARG